MLLSVIIINYNVADLVEKCINSFKDHVKLPGQYEIIVVDNNSLERDIENLPGKYPEVKFIFNKNNLGFGQANNQAYAQSTGENILFLNPDTILVEDFISPILHFIHQNPRAGVCGPKLVNKDQSYQNSTGIRMGYLYEISEALMLINFLRYFYRVWLFKRIEKYDPVRISWMSAACMIIPGKILNEIGGFSPDYFLNYEDIDLCERIRKLDYDIYYFPKFRCIHLDHKSQKQNYEDFVYYRYASRIRYADHHYSFSKKHIVNFFHVLGLVLRIVFTSFVFTGIERNQRIKGYKRAFSLYLQKSAR